MNENWRGAYDLLVTANDEVGDAAVVTSGMVEQNFAAFGGAGEITYQQLDRIRAIDGVDVAAPLAFLGDLRTPASGVLIGASDVKDQPSYFSRVPKAYDVSVRVSASDGIDDKTLNQMSTTLVVGLSESEAGIQAPVLASTEALALSTYDMSADVAMSGVPELASGIVALDPRAESALLGGDSPLAAGLGRLTEFQSRVGEGAGADELAELVPVEFESEHYGVANSPAGTRPVPVVVSDGAYAPVRATVTLTELEGSFSADQLFEGTSLAVGGPASLSAEATQLLANAPRGEPVTIEADLTEYLAPFTAARLAVALPGAPAPPGGSTQQTAPRLDLSSVSRSSFAPAAAATGGPEGIDGAFVAEPHGVVELAGADAREQTYRPAGEALATASNPVWAPIGRYSPGDVSGAAESTSYVPLGTYSAAKTTVAEPGEHQGRTLEPSFSGRGLVVGAPGAITTLEAAQELRPGAGIDVVRVRVAGIDGYTPQAVERIGEIASAIGELGLSVRVVAGSSLAPAAIYLPEFFTDGPDDGLDLGWTIQEWTSLGAAVKVERANLAASIFLFVVTLAGASVLAGAVQVLTAQSRRSETALLVASGWDRWRIFRWYAAEGLLGAGIVAAGVLVALTLNANNPLSLTASVSGAGVYVLLVLAGAVLGMRGPGARAAGKASGKRVRGVSDLALKAAAARAPAMVLAAFALAVIGAAIAAFGHAVTQAAAAAGHSRIAGAVESALLVPNALLAAVSVVAGVALYVQGTRLLRTQLEPSARILAASGWTARELGRYFRITLAVPALAGLALGGVLVTVSALVAADSARTWWIPVAAAASMLVAIAAALLAATREAARLIHPAR